MTRSISGQWRSLLPLDNQKPQSTRRHTQFQSELPVGLPERVALPGSGPDFLEAGWDAMYLSTWWGQQNIKGLTSEMVGVPAQIRNREVDWDYNPVRDEDMRGYRGRALQSLQESTSHQEFLARKYQLDINNDLRHNVEDFPVMHFLSAGFADPINLIPTPLVLGKGFMFGAKRAIALNVPLVVGSEAWRIEMDPTSQRSELLFSTLGGLLFAGLVGGLAGKYKPIGKMTVPEAWDIMLPRSEIEKLSAEAGMFSWLRVIGKGAARRIADNLRTFDNVGANKSSLHAKRIKVERMVDADEVDTIRITYDGIDGEVVTGVIRSSAKEFMDTIHLTDVAVPEKMQNQGIGTAAYRAVIKYAQDNGFRPISGGMTDGAGCERLHFGNNVDFVGVEGVIGSHFQRLVESRLLNVDGDDR